MLNRLINFLFRPHRKLKTDYSICPACGKKIVQPFSGAKDAHFRECHPEYKYKVEKPYEDLFGHSNQRRYTCLVCNKTFPSFRVLVGKHKHNFHEK